MWWWHGVWGWAGWLLMVLGNLAFWWLLVWAVLALVRGNGNGQRSDTDPQGILAARFAAGEIDDEEYRRRLDALRTATRTPERRRP